MRHLLISADISIFFQKSSNFALSRNTDIDCILTHNFNNSSNNFRIFKNCFNKNDYNFDNVSKNSYSRPS